MRATPTPTQEQKQKQSRAGSSHALLRVPTASLLRERGVYVALLALVAVNLAVTPGFAGMDTLHSVLFAAAPLALIAIGQSLAIGTRGIDLSVGSLMALTSAVIPLYTGYGVVPAVLAGIAAAALVGVLNGVLISVVRIDPLITTLASLVAARGLSSALVGGERIGLPFTGLLAALGTRTIAGIPLAALLATVVAVVIGLTVRSTTFGRHLVYTGANRDAALLSGVPIRRTLAVVYIITAVLAGVAGVLATARLGASDPSHIGVLFELNAIAAAVIGGNRLSGGRISVTGALVGALFLQILDATFIMNNINYAYAQILKAGFIVAALYFQRSGESEE